MAPRQLRPPGGFRMLVGRATATLGSEAVRRGRQQVDGAGRPAGGVRVGQQHLKIGPLSAVLDATHWQGSVKGTNLTLLIPVGFLLAVRVPCQARKPRP